MYEAFYGLKEKPFNLTPDPKYLYLSDKHKEAFAHLLYGVKHRSGFVMVTGEIGTGKTTICRNLLNQLDEGTELAFIFNPFLSPVELLKKINQEFGIDHTPDNSLELTDVLNRHLLEMAAQGKNCILVIDEAQNLEPKVLEQVRLLSNLETETQKLLQIILVGQPELTEKLAQHDLRQLNQRITARYHLRELNERETLQYIAYRIHVAGGRKKVQFARRAIRAVYKRSRGTPRLINAICDRALLIGYTKEARTISAGIVNRAAREIRGEHIAATARRANWWRFAPSPAVVAALLLVVVLVRYVAPPLEKLGREIGAFNALLSPGAPPAPETPGSVEARPVDPPAPAPPAAATQNAALATRVLERLAHQESPKPAPVDPAAFEALLRSSDPPALAAASLGAVLAAWGKPAATAGTAADAAALAGAAQRAGLTTERLEATLDQLLAINLPVLLRVKGESAPLWLAVTGETDGAVMLAGTDGPLRAARAALLERFLGEAVLPWADTAPGAPALSNGRQDAQVAGLKDALRRLGRLGAQGSPDTYDAQTTAAVRRLQAETGLQIDGVAGKQVRMVMAGWTGGDGVPALRPRPTLPPAAAPVAAGRTQVAEEPPAAKPSAPPRARKPSPAPAAPAPAPAFFDMPGMDAIDLPAPVAPPLLDAANAGPESTPGAPAPAVN